MVAQVDNSGAQHLGILHYSFPGRLETVHVHPGRKAIDFPEYIRFRILDGEGDEAFLQGCTR